MKETLSKESAEAVQAQQIAHYYDANTGKFLRFGGAGATGAIHRAIWAPGVDDRREAFEFLNRLVANAITPLIASIPQDTQLIDLGCGVGGTAYFLAKQLGISITGISISEAQIKHANAYAQRTALGQRLQFIQADFDCLPSRDPVDAIYAIESFVHSRDAKAFFAQAACLLKPNGRLIICDDFLGGCVSKKGKRYVERFKKGWHLNNLCTVKAVEAIAQQNGLKLVESHSLSEYVRGFPEALRWLIDGMSRIPLPWAYWHNLSGGTALQLCVKRGWTEYHALVWEKR